MIPNNLLQDQEWYDNSFLVNVDKCERKGFWGKLFQLPPETDSDGQLVNVPVGIAQNMGIPPLFGTCVHAAHDRFYSPLLANEPERRRRILAQQAFSASYHKLIVKPEDVETKYSHERGLDLLTMYFDHWAADDALYKYIETEVAWLLHIEHQPDDPFEFDPFKWVSRADGMILHLAYDHYLIDELKTSGSPELQIQELKLSRQVRGYFSAANEFKPLDNKPLYGARCDVIATRAAESDPQKLFFRETIPLSEIDAAVWRLETIRKVQKWRKIRDDAAASGYPISSPLLMAMFASSTHQCMNMGKCSYYDLCLYGVNSVDLAKFSPNRWNPLYTDKMEIE